MSFNTSDGRLLGLVAIVALSFAGSPLEAAGSSASSKGSEVAVKYKSKGLPEFHLADYQDELVQCSALAAMHTWIGDNIGQDAGSEVRRVLGEDYWFKISTDYLSLAKKASGKADLSQEFRTQIKGLTVEWRRLTETRVGPEDWAGWYDLVDRCDTWRPANAKRRYYSRGRDSMAAHAKAENMAG